MTYIEDGLRVRNGFAEEPLADAALDRGARAGQLLDELQERPETMTGFVGESGDGLSTSLSSSCRSLRRKLSVRTDTAIGRPECQWLAESIES